MDCILVHGIPIPEEVLRRKLGSAVSLIVFSRKRELILHIIEGPNIRGLLFFASKVLPEDLKLYESLRRHFPLVKEGLCFEGAFLESDGCPLPPGMVAEISIYFQNVRMTAQCEIMEPRNASSNLPFGFPVRFRSLSQESKTTINTIVKDALFQILIEPQDEPEIPTLDEDLLTTDFQRI